MILYLIGTTKLVMMSSLSAFVAFERKKESRRFNHQEFGVTVAYGSRQFTKSVVTETTGTFDACPVA